MKQNAARYTAKELQNMGYSRADAARMVTEGRNWKATKGGKRKPLDLSVKCDPGPITTAEAIRRCEVMRKLRNAAAKLDTHTPDSLGDQMVRCCLAYGLAQSGHGEETPAQVVERAEKLLSTLNAPNP